MNKIISRKPLTRIASWYIEWATTLDSAGRDSRHVQARAKDAVVMKALWHCLNAVIFWSEMMDRFKRYLFYGQDANLAEIMEHDPIQKIPEDRNVRDDLFRAQNLMQDHRTVMLVHSMMGLVTEAGELALMIKRSLFYGEPIDLINVHEELGDITWYVGIGGKATGVNSLERILAGNHDKLVSRYGDTWGHDRALEANRDKVRERTLVQQSMVNPVRPQLFYIASPRTHPVREVIDDRVAQVHEYTHYLLLQGIHAFSPIVHNHTFSNAGYLTKWDDWKDFDSQMLARCDALVVLCLDGWEGSVGVSAEIKLADELGIPISYVSPVTSEEVYQEARNRAVRIAGGPVFSRTNGKEASQAN